MKTSLERLTDSAAAEGLLDVAYANVDSPYGPLLVAVDLSAQPAQGGAQDPRLAALGRQIAATKDVASVSPPSVNGDGTAAVFTVTRGCDSRASRAISSASSQIKPKNSLTWCTSPALGAPRRPCSSADK